MRALSFVTEWCKRMSLGSLKTAVKTIASAYCILLCFSVPVSLFIKFIWQGRVTWLASVLLAFVVPIVAIALVCVQSQSKTGKDGSGEN